VKKLKYLYSAFLVASLLAIPAAAQKGAMGHHNSGFGQPHGQMGADKANDKGNQNPDSDKGKKKRKRKRKGDKDPAASMNKNGNGNHNAEGHIH